MAEHTAKEVIKLLKVNGYIEVAIRGDHHKYKGPKGRVVIINYSRLKDSISQGVFKDIEKAINGKSKWQMLHKS